MTYIPHPSYGILTVRRVRMCRSLDIPCIVYIPFAIHRSGVAIYTDVEANLGQLIIGLLWRIRSIRVGYQRGRCEVEDLIPVPQTTTCNP